MGMGRNNGKSVTKGKQCVKCRGKRSTRGMLTGDANAMSGRLLHLRRSMQVHDRR